MTNHKLAVVGSGITGLTAAWNLKNEGKAVDIFEQHGYAGGAIKSIRENDWLLEYGPNTLLLKDQKVAAFLEKIGVLSQKVVANPESSKRFIVKNGQLTELPSSVIDGLTTPLFSAKAKLRLLGEPFIKKKSKEEEETVAEFVERRIGKEFLDYALNPFIAGIYANKPENLSLRHTFPMMHDLEQDYTSLIWGAYAGRKERRSKGRIKRQLISFESGLHQIVDSITAQLNEIFFNHEIKNIQKTENGWYLDSKFGKKGPYQHVILNVPLYRWNEDFLPIKKNELQIVNSVEYPPLSLLHLGFRKTQIKHPLDGFGFLVPEKENRNILGALFSSTLFPGRAPDNSHLLTVFVGGGRQPDLAKMNSEKLLEMVLSELEDLVGLNGKPQFKEHIYWPHSIPAYHVGYEAVLNVFQSIEERNRGLHLAGNFRKGVSVPDCIKSGINLSDSIISNE